ncbi:NAD(P)H:quinone oxidoreductase [Salisediminibacterium selenitireducens]|uniref:Flavoprotein WrbA n=1 Tax=Bacillus selenitireducens (strain ATCC 700615 / DSM 15326 / MLS10) TaxID=439292 RepID=D6XXB0_BACIE|nr:NAD(P)H:quinone oxidoreductase [Salisediminibacterium selenitireducens]ADH97967.1 flavoprotein WrbA [[Bacillus] selenitireducens MLS10]
MTDVNVAVVYYSSTGTNHQLAKWAEEGAKAAGAANVKFLRIPELAPEAAIASNPAWEAHYNETKDIPEATPDDLDWADAVIFSIPSRFGTVPGQVKQFIDTTGGLWAQGKLVNKVVSAMSSASNAHGGQEATIQSLYTNMHHWGAIIASPGYADPVQFASGGNPYGVSVTVDQEGKMVEDVKDAVHFQAKRTVTIASYIKKGMQG